VIPRASFTVILRSANLCHRQSFLQWGQFFLFPRLFSRSIRGGRVSWFASGILWLAGTFVSSSCISAGGRLSGDFSSDRKLGRNFFSVFFLSSKADQPFGRVFWSCSLLDCLFGRVPFYLPHEVSSLGVFCVSVDALLLLVFIYFGF